MHGNRITAYFEGTADMATATAVSMSMGASFAVCPLTSAVPMAWMQQIYQAAFEHARQASLPTILDLAYAVSLN